MLSVNCKFLIEKFYISKLEMINIITKLKSDLEMSNYIVFLDMIYYICKDMVITNSNVILKALNV